MIISDRFKLGLMIFTLTLSPVWAQNFTQIVLPGDNGWTEGGNWIDYDDDGDLDLFLPNNRRSPNFNFLYRNDGNDVFAKVDTGIIVTDIVMSESGTWGDYDNDGDLDLFVADGGFDLPRFNSLYRNEGGGYFVEITSTPLSSESSFSTSSGWADYDNDGDLDLYCANLQLASNPSQQTSPDFLYQNNGDGTFTKRTTGVIATTLTRSFGISWSDYDNDNDVDLFVCNGSGNILYRNDGDGILTRMTASQVGAIASDGGGLACSWGDYNNDGFQDLFVGRFGANDLLYQNNGNGTFTKITTGAIVTNSSERAEGSAWGDFDNDGDLDLIVGNGGASFGTNYLYRNDGNGAFTRITSTEITGLQGCYVGTTWGDYDNDGDLDLFMGNFSGKSSSIFRNDQSGNSWLNVQCIGTTSNRSAIGTKVRVKAVINGEEVWQLREISGQTGYNAQNSLRAHFGLGEAVRVDSLVVEWPSGTVDVFSDFLPNKFTTVTEGGTITGVQAVTVNEVADFRLGQNYPNPFNPTTTIEYELTNDSQVVLQVYNLLGQQTRTLVNQSQPPGMHSAVWDGRNDLGQMTSSGIYIYRLQVGSFTQTRKMIFLQ